jgi:hypothetical protein
LVLNIGILASIKMKTDYQLTSKDVLTTTAINLGLRTWNQLLLFIKQLPYGRNANRFDLALVLTELKGTCSSKHALIKSIADLNKVPDVKLIIGIYKMNALNTPKIGSVLNNCNLTFIPEAHCYLKINGVNTDLTTHQSEFKIIEKDIIQEVEIEPEQVATFKISYHKDFLKNWLRVTNVKYTLDEIWALREACIKNITDN